MKIITRYNAIKRYLKTYFTGEPCIHGHISERRTSNQHCIECSKEQTKIWQQANPNKVSIATAKWRKANPKKVIQASVNWQKNNRGKATAIRTKRKERVARATPPWADHDLIEMYYTISAWCTKHLGEAYHVDHIIPLQHDHVCGLHVSKNLDVIPAAVNLRKNNKWETDNG